MHVIVISPVSWVRLPRPLIFVLQLLLESLVGVLLKLIKEKAFLQVIIEGPTWMYLEGVSPLSHSVPSGVELLVIDRECLVSSVQTCRVGRCPDDLDPDDGVAVVVEDLETLKVLLAPNGDGRVLRTGDDDLAVGGHGRDGLAVRVQPLDAGEGFAAEDEDEAGLETADDVLGVQAEGGDACVAGEDVTVGVGEPNVLAEERVAKEGGEIWNTNIKLSASF